MSLTARLDDLKELSTQKYQAFLCCGYRVYIIGRIPRPRKTVNMKSCPKTQNIYSMGRFCGGNFNQFMPRCEDWHFEPTQ